MLMHPFQSLSIDFSPDSWVTCANRYDVDAFDKQQRACAYPCQQLNRYHVVKEPAGAPEVLSNGTVSLALKHKLACFDMLQRNLPAALILEDDAVLPLDLWGMMARVFLPASANIFWMGSYSRRTNVGTLSDHEPVHLAASTAPLSSHSGPISSQHAGGLIHVYRRSPAKFPTILGAVSYVMFASGARIVASEPVTPAADLPSPTSRVPAPISAQRAQVPPSPPPRTRGLTHRTARSPMVRALWTASMARACTSSARPQSSTDPRNG